MGGAVVAWGVGGAVVAWRGVDVGVWGDKHLRKEGVERRSVDEPIVARAELDDARRRRAGQKQPVALRNRHGAVALELERKLHRLVARHVLGHFFLRGRRRRARRRQECLHLGRVGGREDAFGRRRGGDDARAGGGEGVVSALGGTRGDKVVRAQRRHVRLGELSQLGERRLARLQRGELGVKVKVGV